MTTNAAPTFNARLAAWLDQPITYYWKVMVPAVAVCLSLVAGGAGYLLALETQKPVVVWHQLESVPAEDLAPLDA